MIGRVMEFGMNVGTEQFRGLSQTSPRTIRDAEENQHGAIVASTALEQIMRLSIGIGLCEPWQPPAWMDFVVLEMDIIIPSLWKFLFCSLRQYSVARPTFQLPFKPSNPSRLSTNSYPTTANHPNPSCDNHHLQPIKIISPKHPTIAYKLLPFQCQAPHRHLQTLSII